MKAVKFLFLSLSLLMQLNNFYGFLDILLSRSESASALFETQTFKSDAQEFFSLLAFLSEPFNDVFLFN